MVVPKEKLGIMAKPSTRMTATLAAMTIVPKAVGQRLDDDHGQGEDGLGQARWAAPSG